MTTGASFVVIVVVSRRQVVLSRCRVALPRCQ
jgi:hypothetical protein